MSPMQIKTVVLHLPACAVISNASSFKATFCIGAGEVFQPEFDLVMGAHGFIMLSTRKSL